MLPRRLSSSSHTGKTRGRAHDVFFLLARISGCKRYYRLYLNRIAMVFSLKTRRELFGLSVACLSGRIGIRGHGCYNQDDVDALWLLLKRHKLLICSSHILCFIV